MKKGRAAIMSESVDIIEERVKQLNNDGLGLLDNLLEILEKDDNDETKQEVLRFFESDEIDKISQAIKDYMAEKKREPESPEEELVFIVEEWIDEVVTDYVRKTNQPAENNNRLASLSEEVTRIRVQLIDTLSTISDKTQITETVNKALTEATGYFMYYANSGMIAFYKQGFYDGVSFSTELTEEFNDKHGAEAQTIG